MQISGGIRVTVTFNFIKHQNILRNDPLIKTLILGYFPECILKT